MDKMKIAKELREEAHRLEVEAHAERPLPKKWEVGMRVRFLRDSEWAWSKGSEATVVTLSEDCKDRKGGEYQVFWTEPDGGGATWWTTPDDVEFVTNNSPAQGRP